MRILYALLVTVGLSLSLAACQGGPLVPTPTAVPLAATATPTPLPDSPTGAPSASATATVPPMTPAVKTLPTATAAVYSYSFDLDERLAMATVRGFLDHLAAGNAASASTLYLTDSARAGEPGRMLTRLAESGAQLLDARLIELKSSDTIYRAQVELLWGGHQDQGPGTQPLTLVLRYQRGLWLVDEIVLDALQAATPTPTRRPSTGSRARPPDLEGKLVFQTSSGGDLYTINADGSGLRRLTDGLDPAWSPDGTQIAFTRWRTPWGLYLINQDGSGERRVVDATSLKGAAWSPDGSRLAFTIDHGSTEPLEICFGDICFTIPPKSNNQLWSVDLETGGMLSLPVVDQAIHTPAWSPTGTRIVYSGQQGLAWIDLEDMLTGRLAGSVWDRSPAFSPGGAGGDLPARIAFMGRVHNRWEIFVINADGSGRTQLTFSDPTLQTAPSNVAPTWSPDGKQIAFLSNRDGRWRIYVMEADGSNQRPMFGDKLDGLGLRYEWASEHVLSWSR